MSKIEREVNGIKFTVELGSGFDQGQGASIEYREPSFLVNGVSMFREHFEAALRLAALHGAEPEVARVDSRIAAAKELADREDHLLRTSVFL